LRLSSPKLDQPPISKCAKKEVLKMSDDDLTSAVEACTERAVWPIKKTRGDQPNRRLN
jgi:hypothetical protein